MENFSIKSFNSFEITITLTQKEAIEFLATKINCDVNGTIDINFCDVKNIYIYDNLIKKHQPLSAFYRIRIFKYFTVGEIRKTAFLYSTKNNVLTYELTLQTSIIYSYWGKLLKKTINKSVSNNLLYEANSLCRAY